MSEQTFDEHVMTLPDSHCRCKGCPGLHGGCPCCRGMVGPELPDDLYESPSEYECEQEKIAEAFAAAAPKPVTHTMVEVSLLDQANATIATQAAELAATQQRIAIQDAHIESQDRQIELAREQRDKAITAIQADLDRINAENERLLDWANTAETERDEARAHAERYRAALVYRCDLYTQCLVCHNMLTWSEAARWNGHEPLGHTDYCPVGPIMDATAATPTPRNPRRGSDREPVGLRDAGLGQFPWRFPGGHSDHLGHCP